MIASDGIPYLVGAAIGAGIAFFFGAWPVGILVLLLLVFFVNFFRDPNRTPDSSDPRDLVSPADGVVIVKGEVPEHERFPECADLPVFVSIFMNVFDVHVNRAPADGTFTHVVPRGGLKLKADALRARLENERVLWRLDTGRTGPVAFAQVAGLLARRIVARKKAGDVVRRGERIGMIKFGSRVDLYLPAGTEIPLEIGQRTWAGKSVVARLPEPKP